MFKPISSTLLLVVLATAARASSEEVHMPPPMPMPILGPRNAVDHFTLGTKVAGAVPVYTFQNAVTYDSPQSEITLHLDYPIRSNDAGAADDANNDDDDSDNAVITQVYVYLEGNEGFQTQAYLTEGGIGQRAISIEIVANDTEFLRYTIIVFALKD